MLLLSWKKSSLSSIERLAPLLAALWDIPTQEFPDNSEPCAQKIQEFSRQNPGQTYVSCLLLASPVQEEYGTTGESPAKHHS